MKWQYQKHSYTDQYPYDRDWYTIRTDPGNHYIAQLNQIDAHTSVNIEANAALIAAAPEMYDLLRKLHRELTNGLQASEEQLDQIDAVLKRAEGREP